VFERIILKSKYENCYVRVGFSWLRMKSNVSLCQEYKLFSPVKT